MFLLPLSQNSRLIGVIFAFVFAFLLSATTSFGEDISVEINGKSYSLIQNPFCPPQPSIEEGNCTAVCPEGYHLASTGEVSLDETGGYYVCMPDEVENQAGIYQTCVYYNSNCLKSPVDKVIEEKTGKKFNEIFGQEENSPTFVDRLVALATLNLEGAFSGGKVPTSLKFLKELVENAQESIKMAFIGYTIPAFFWLIALFSFTHILESSSHLPVGSREDFLSYIKGRFPDVFHPKVYALRTLAVIFLFLAPAPEKASDGQYYYRPLLAKLVNFYVDLGNSVADEFAKLGVKSFVHYAINVYEEIDETSRGYLERSIPKTYLEIVRIKGELEICKRIYGVRSFSTIPYDKLQDVPIVNEELLKKHLTYSRRFCKREEEKFRRLIGNYNSMIISYKQKKLSEVISELNLSNIFENPDMYVESGVGVVHTKADMLKFSIASIVKTVKDVGWVGFPLVTFPLFSVISSQEDIVKEIASGKGVDPNLLAKVVAYLSFPPGNMIFSFVKDISDGVLNVLVGVLVPVLGSVGVISSLAIPFASSILKGAVSAVSTIITIFVAYNLTVIILKSLPAVFLGIVFGIRFLLWIVEILKTILVAPFVLINAFLPQRAQRVWGFLQRALSLGVYPLLLLLSSVLAFMGAMLVDVAFTYPINYAFDILGKAGYFDVVKFSVAGHQFSALGSLVKPFLVALICYLAVLMKIYLIYKILTNAPEKFLEIAGFREFTPSGTSLGAEVIEASRRIVSPV